MRRISTRLAFIAATAAAVIALGAVAYRPWEAHYAGRPASWWAAQLSRPAADRTDSVVPSPLGEWADALRDWIKGPKNPKFALADHPEAVPVLVELLAHPEEEVRAQAAWCLYDGDRDELQPALPVVAELLFARNPDVRLIAVHILDRIPVRYPEMTHSVVPTLIRALRHDDSMVRRAAGQLLLHLSPEEAKRAGVQPLELWRPGADASP